MMMVQVGKPQALWAKTEAIDNGERTIRYALRRDGSLVTSADEGEGDDWVLVSDADATPEIMEMHRRMGASGFALIDGTASVIPDETAPTNEEPQL